MSGAGQSGVVTIWNGIADGARDEFYRWHETEHMPERLGIPGFLRGRRYRVVGEGIEFFTRYDVESPAVLTSKAYLARLNAPTEWTRRVLPQFRDTARALCVPLQGGPKHSRAWLATLRVFADANVNEDILVQRVHGVSRAAAGFGGSVELLKTDDAASAIPTAERKSRRPDAENPRWIILAEARDQQDTTHLSQALLAALPECQVEATLYCLEYDLS